jgi:hypothetical protein
MQGVNEAGRGVKFWDYDFFIFFWMRASETSEPTLPIAEEFLKFKQISFLWLKKRETLTME